MAEDQCSSKINVLRCEDWVQKQNSQESKKLSLQNKNDIQFIIQTNADRKKFLLAAAEDDASLPFGVDEIKIKPRKVPLHKLRVSELRLECEWHSCRYFFNNYDMFQKHVKEHIKEIHVIKKDTTAEYVCLWDICGHKTSDFQEMVRHISYHSYHSRLLAIGFNGRATLELERCRKDSTKRNQLPPLNTEHCCMWTGCEKKFNAVQMFFDHVKLHISYSDNHLCSWAGCGATFPRRVLLTMHVRSHTGERLIACYHCGQHFACNRKLCDHLRRQNVSPNSNFICSLCNISCATEYLLREHARQHVSAYACAWCDMSAQSPATLAQHVRYRHLPAADTRDHACPQCPYKAVTKYDLKKHIIRHKRKQRKENPEENSSEEEAERKKTKVEAKQYACHLCPHKVFSRGARLTAHLVKVHEAQWPFGYSRFRYQISEDGMYRLTTTRFEVLEVSKKIVDGYSDPKESLSNAFEFDVKQTAEPTETSPRKFDITLKNGPGEETDKGVEITMCDVDEHGNVIKSEVIQSGVLYT